MQVEILQAHREFTRGETPDVPKVRAEAMIEMSVARPVEKKRGRPKKKK